PSTGLVEWTPETAGSYTIHLRVTNAVGTDLQSYPLEVSDPPAPVITSLPDTQGEVNQPYAYQAGAVGVEPISWAVDGPAGMTIGAANGLVQWTPATTGTFPVTVTATNVGGTAVQSYALHIYPFDGANQLYWNTGPRLQRADLDALEAINMYFALPSNLGPLERDQLNNRLYWVEGDDPYETGTSYILRSDSDGQNVETLFSGLNSVHGLAVDPYQGFLYWNDYVGGTLQRSDLDGSNPVALITGLRNPRDLEIDFGNGRLYWLSGDPTGFYIPAEDVYLMSANLDGSDMVTVTAALGNTYDFVLDGEAGAIYWHSGAEGAVSIHRAELDPAGASLSNIVDLYSGLPYVSGLFVDLDDNQLYWTDDATGNEVHYIWRGDADGSAPPVQLNLDDSGVDFLLPQYLT